MGKNCGDIAPLLTGFIDGEINETEKILVQEHLKYCSHCAKVVETEQAIKKLVKKQYRFEKAPVQLRSRIRRMLADERHIAGFFEMLAEAFALHKIKGGLAIAALAVLMVLPYIKQNAFFANAGQNFVASNNGHHYISFEGEVICLDCEVLQRANKVAQHTPDHRIGIKTADGRVWNIMATTVGKKILHDGDLIHKKIKIEGVSFPNELYLDVEKFGKI